MYDLAKLCEKIDMPKPVTRALLDCSDPAIPGLAVLKAHLEAACLAWDTYRELDISEGIYVATMAAFSRFVREHRESFGIYGFDRAFWTTRQTGCVLFRIGELEYELLEENGQRFVSLHIPSDAVLTAEGLAASRLQADALIARCFPEFARVPWCCHSWLLSQDLPALLPPNSRIKIFQEGFYITPQSDDGEFMQWVYGREGIPLEELPERTGLQRKLKAFLLAGNAFYSGYGLLKADAWAEA